MEYKQVCYDNEQNCRNHYKLKSNPKEVNRRYKHYNQVIFTAGDVDQFMSKLIYKNDEILCTFKYLYHKFKKGIFVMIKNNEMITFLPFSKNSYVNDWNHMLDIDNVKTVMNKLHTRYDWDFSHWYANNCIIRNEFPSRENDNGYITLEDKSSNYKYKQNALGKYFVNTNTGYEEITNLNSLIFSDKSLKLFKKGN